MAQMLNKLLLNRHIYLLSKNSKRFAGHSKWSNIKHTKEENDNKRMLQFHFLKSQMKIAVQENGGITNPSHNLKLSQVIEQAKKANMPVASIKSFLDKMEARKNKTQSGILEIRGPNGYILLVRYTTDNAKLFVTEVNSKLKKTRGKVTDSSVKNRFIHTGSVIVEKKGNLDQAMEDAINIGADDVEEFKEYEVEYFQFKCDPKFLNKITNLLEKSHYHVLSVEEDYTPQTTIELNESDLKAVSHIREKILNFEDVNNLYDNLA